MDPSAQTFKARQISSGCLVAGGHFVTVPLKVYNTNKLTVFWIGGTYMAYAWGIFNFRLWSLSSPVRNFQQCWY